jgi:hypothetical protein
MGPVMVFGEIRNVKLSSGSTVVRGFDVGKEAIDDVD